MTLSLSKPMCIPLPVGICVFAAFRAPGWPSNQARQAVCLTVWSPRRFRFLHTNNAAASRDRPALGWLLMNVCALDFPDESFNAVVDKGTLDSVLCGEGSTANVAKMCMEISRVLKPNGVYFICSYGVPDNRLQVRGVGHDEKRLFAPSDVAESLLLPRRRLRLGCVFYQNGAGACLRFKGTAIEGTWIFTPNVDDTDLCGCVTVLCLPFGRFRVR